MSYVIAGPAAIAAATTELAGIGSTISQANVNAAAVTAGVPAAAADQVSAAVAAFFGAQAQGYQGISTQMAAFHDQLVQALSAGGAAYADAEAASAQNLLDLINAPALALFGRPWIGNGADGGTVGGIGQPGGPGGLLYGNGGRGGDSTLAGVAGGNGGPPASSGTAAPAAPAAREAAAGWVATPS
ncbi:PE family protein [Mycobacterium kansasii 662]|uniref:PE family protein n=1 Tax=Mycobacterium kansasii 662 TaxID=1299326 RepID=X7ZMM3_MYCKA|nr:PE family protein [Mycobacterium kansasii 662]